ncbi:MAG TPA: aldo/keto reductase [Spirochaetota bacterium]|nr:aldo/keto reductase [Spirochaetota bacterium]
MKYVQFKDSGMEISQEILGTWAIGGANWGPYDQDDALRAINTALDYGINCIDTAPAYGSGRAETLIGDVIQGKRDKVFIATKCGLDVENGFITTLAPDFIEKDLGNSLRRLRTDYIDLYQCHWPDPNTPLEKTMAALTRFREQGKIKYIGVSNFSSDQLREAAQFADIATLQPPYSLLDRNIEQDIRPACLDLGIDMIPYGSLGGGMLTGKYKEWPNFKKDDARSFFYPFFQKKYWPKVRTLVDRIEEIAKTKNVKPANIAFAWIIAQKGVLAAIAGARSPQQVLENSKGIDISLTEEECGSLDMLSKAVYEE